MRSAKLPGEKVNAAIGLSIRAEQLIKDIERGVEKLIEGGDLADARAMLDSIDKAINQYGPE